MTDDQLKEMFLSAQALKAGHFKLSSGRHAEQYFQCALLLADPRRAERLGQALAAKIPDGERPDTVVAPAMGGLIIGHEVARALGVRSIFTERQEGGMTFRRGFAVAPEEKVLVVEDVITTGKSTGEVLDVLRHAGAQVVGAAAIVLRAPEPLEFKIPVHALAHWPARSWQESECPLCAKGEPVIKPGSRDFKKEGAC